jgi:hypothetical protein
VVEIKTDQYPSEITWNIKNASGVIVASGGNYPTANAVNTHTYCLPTACYTFNITDGYGDGILAPGYFKVSQGTVVLVSNSAYTLSKSVSFCIGNTTVATCSDGIKNGTETGVDCGGSCTPCSTCSDGIKNGNETGIDCGGSCTPCATCGDGIKNGTETGVDCGGTCTPCNTSITVLSGHYFETGMDGWADGGTDCYRYQGALSPEGSYAIRLRDNSDSESAMTSAFYNLSAYNTVKIEFKFRANGMENGEDFWFRYYNGSSWSTVNTFVAGTNFVNNQLYTITVTLTGQFPTNAQFRFQCDASENDDEVFIDAVIISANKGSSLIDGPFTIQSENNVVYEEKLSSDFLLTPNPAEHFVRIKANDQIKRINVFNMAGQWLPVAVNNNAELDISGLSSGIYMVKIETEEETFTERLVKI